MHQLAEKLQQNSIYHYIRQPNKTVSQMPTISNGYGKKFKVY